VPRRNAVPYGYRRIDDAQGNYVTQLPVEPQASVVREIISRAAQGQAIAGILRELESRGVPAPRGGPRWSWTVVHDIARNPAYIGRPADGADPDDLDRVHWTPLVPDQLFFAAQRVLAPPPGGPAGTYQVLGLLLCALGPCRELLASYLPGS
jgi:site-specific DNA recombinase